MVLLHALGERGSNWSPVLTRLAESFRVVAPDLRGHGGPDSHIPQDKLAAVAARIPACDLVTIPAGHHVHSARPAEFATAVLTWLPVRIRAGMTGHVQDVLMGG